MRSPSAGCTQKLSFDAKAIIPRKPRSTSRTPPSTIPFARPVAKVERSRTSKEEDDPDDGSCDLLSVHGGWKAPNGSRLSCGA